MRTALIFVISLVPCALPAQVGPKPQDEHVPSGFEVASAKRNTNAPPGRMTFQALPGGRLTAENMPLRLLIQRAYGLRSFQISGGPSWIDSERYDIAAKTDHPVPDEQVMGPMLQWLLESGFGLKIRRETRQLAVLDLVEAGTGAKLSKSKAADCANRDPHDSSTASPLPCHEAILSISPTGARLLGEQATTAQLVFTLANIIDDPSSTIQA